MTAPLLPVPNLSFHPIWFPY